MTLRVDINSSLPDFEKMGDVFRDAVSWAFWRIGEHAKARAVDNTPIDTSRLRGSIKAKVRKHPLVIGVELTAGPVLNPQTGIPYEYHVHKNFIPADGGTIRARLRQRTPEGMVGGDYLTRVAHHNIGKYKRFLKKVIDRSIRAGRTVGDNFNIR